MSIKTRYAFNNMLGVLRPVVENEFPTGEYASTPDLSFTVEFISERTVRLKFISGPDKTSDAPSLMLVNGIAPKSKKWDYSFDEGKHIYQSKYERF